MLAMYVHYIGTIHPKTAEQRAERAGDAHPAPVRQLARHHHVDHRYRDLDGGQRV